MVQEILKKSRESRRESSASVTTEGEEAASPRATRPRPLSPSSPRPGTSTQGMGRQSKKKLANIEKHKKMQEVLKTRKRLRESSASAASDRGEAALLSATPPRPLPPSSPPRPLSPSSPRPDQHRRLRSSSKTTDGTVTLSPPDQHKRLRSSSRTTDGTATLSWNNHSATLCHMLSVFRHKDKYTDAMLACEGKFYPVHKLVLSTCSQYFEEMFDHTLGKHPIVLLQDVKCDEIEALLNFMYVGIVSVAQKDLTRFFKVAELLQIKGLAVAGEVQRDKNTLSSSNSRNARQSPQSREFVDSTDGRGSPHPKRRKQDDTSSPSPMLSSHSKDSEERLDYRTSDDRSRIELHLEQVRGSESETESLHHKGSTTSNSVPEESNMLSGVKLQEQSATRNPSMDISENMIYIKEEVWEDPAIVIKEEVWEDPELSHNNSIDPSFTYSIASDSADPDSHDGVHEEHTGTSKEFSYPGVPVQGSQELAETVVEALAGPSGMQEWHSHS